ncbi:hypothetical protein OF829_13925 [Sphingomonas sp. LB-2]|nr:hypothetical protein [Sphingomonas caeni]MCW3848339.1 hypothetical protein [Sphingomonas caeni]
MIIVFGVLAVMCGLLIWAAEHRDRPRRRAERQARMIQPAE